MIIGIKMNEATNTTGILNISNDEIIKQRGYFQKIK